MKYCVFCGREIADDSETDSCKPCRTGEEPKAGDKITFMTFMSGVAFADRKRLKGYKLDTKTDGTAVLSVLGGPQ